MMSAMSGRAEQAVERERGALPVIIVGAGPAGLATAACLGRRGIEAVVFEAAPSLGHAWRNHYDRLHLHTVKGRSHLPGLRFARDVPRYPSRADVVAYLESYAERFGIAPRTGEPVVRVAVAPAGGYRVETAGAAHRARAVVIATGFNRAPNVARLPDQDTFRGTLLHAASYGNGQRFAGQRVLVVGAGNTGAELALDLAEQGATPTLAVRSGVNVVPRDFLGLPIQVTSIWMRGLPLALSDRIGRAVSRLAFGDLARRGLPRAELGPLSAVARRRRIPLIDVGTVAAIDRGAITVKPAVARLTATGAVFADGSAADFDAIVLATGFHPALAEIVTVPGALDDAGYPRASRGTGVAGNIFFVGYRIVATGHLREIGIEARAVAAAIAAS
jgi:cation diffusion facilitator CzcD-associated flavoprotein CzcO